VTYWDNKIQAYTQIAGEEGIALPDSYREPAGTDPEEMEKRASGSAAPFLEAVKSNRRQELMKDRPEVIAELGGGLADVIGFRDRYKQLRNLKFSLRPKEMRPGTVIDPKVQAEREQALIEQRLALGFAPDATEADIDPAIAAVSAALEAVANPTVDTIMSRVAVPAEEPKQKGKTKEIPPEEERLIFDRKQNVSDQLNRRIQQAQNGLAFMSKLHVIRSWQGEAVIPEAQVVTGLLDQFITGEMVTVHAEQLTLVEEAYNQIQAVAMEEVTTEYDLLARRVNTLWSQMNEATLGEKMARKRAIEDEVHDEVTEVKDLYSSQLLELRRDVMQLYSRWRNSMIAAIAEQGFTLS
jgi:hypothetical protein